MAKVDPSIIMKGLIDRGFRPHEAAGIVGNIAQESGFDTGAREINPQTESARKKGGGFGLFQWTSPERKQSLYNMAQMRGAKVDDLDLQLDHFTHEMQTSHKKALKALEATKDPRHAAYVVSKYYEIPSEKYANNARRMSTAEKIFNMLNPIGTAQAEEVIDPAEFDAWEKSQSSQPVIDPAEFDAWERSQKDWAGKDTLQAVRDVGGGFIKGASNIGNTLLMPIDYAANKVGINNSFIGRNDRKQEVTEGLKGQRAKPESVLYKSSELGAEVAGTLGLGGLLSKGAKAVPVLSNLSNVIANAGIKGGNMIEKIIGGGINGAVSTGLVTGDAKEAGKGAVTGMVLPPLLYGAGKIIGFVGNVGNKMIDIVNPERAGARAMYDELTGNLPKQAPEGLGAMGKVEGVKPTVGMLSDDPALIRLEMNARLRNPEKFMARDAENTSKVVSTIEKNALSDKAANELQDALNLKTGKLRESAYKKAKENPKYRDELVKYLDELSNTPGIRNSEAMKIIDRGKQSLIMIEKDGGKISDAMPEDIYAFRKVLSDKLKLKTITTDELSNAIKDSRRLSVDMENAIDSELDSASGGLWSKYLEAHKKGMKPIEQGRAFQNILDKFETAPRILGTEQPKITPSALRKAVDNETWENIGKKGYVSTISNKARKELDSAVAVMNAIEKAKNGSIATNGSQTMTFAKSLEKSGLLPSGKVAKVVNLLNDIFESRGQKALDDAMLNPEKLQAIIDKAEKIKRKTKLGGKMGELLSLSVKGAPVLITQGRK